jgi:hypothetical protein
VVALGRHEQEIAARLEHADHLREEGLVVLDVLQEVDRRHDVERAGPERNRPLVDLQHAVAHQLPRRPDVIPLEVGAGPGAAPLAQEVGGESGTAPHLQAGAALDRRQVRQERVDRLPLLEGAAKELELPRLGQSFSIGGWILGFTGPPVGDA